MSFFFDDGSFDGSEKIIEKRAKNNDKIRILHHPKNLGQGAALRTGFFAASKEIIIYTDIDLPFDLSLLKQILTYLKNFDVIHGYRKKSKRRLTRKTYSIIYNFLIKSLFGLKIKDTMFAMLIFKRTILNEIDLRSKSAFLKSEFLFESKRKDKRIKEIPVEYFPRKQGISKFNSFSVIFKILFDIFKFRLNKIDE